MSVSRIPVQARPTPIKGESAPQVRTEAGVKPQEISAAQKLQSAVTVDVLDAFLKARAGKPVVERGLLPSLQRLMGSKPAPSSEAVAMQKSLGAAITSLGAIYADGLVTEGELSSLHQARGQLRAVLGLADPAVLNMLPKDVREKLQNNLLDPLAVLDKAAGRRADRVFVQVQQRDEPALRERLGQEPVYRHVDVKGLQSAGIPAFGIQRYAPGDLVCVPRSDGSFQKGVVVENTGKDLRVETIDNKSGGFALKTLSAADVAAANPLKIGDYLELPGVKLWVTGTGPQGVQGRMLDSSGTPKSIDAARIAQLSVAASTQGHQAPITQPQSKPTASSSASAAAVSSIGPRSSRTSLDLVLDTVWKERPKFLAGQLSVYSDVYNAVLESNVLTQPKGKFLADIAGVAASRPKGHTSNTQGFGGSGDGITPMVDAWKAGQMPTEGQFSAKRLEGTFFRFERGPQWQPETIKQRVYLNAAADRATSVMKFVVQQIIDNPQKFPGVEMAKLSGPGAVGGRCENIVIYTSGDEASKRVLDAVAAYQAQHASHFMIGVPAFTEQVSPGVATGDEPAIGGGQMSFGSLRAGVIESALKEADKNGLDRAGFGRLVDEKLRRSQVDPSRPHKNLGVS
ncbi:MAG: T3SS effector HopA1 family protein [Deltaproteobacteria bacterium]|nr:T3SS effector HopA1 family protein [Deltaproteobacteria bacterium]